MDTKKMQAPVGQGLTRTTHAVPTLLKEVPL